jgi:hypothetical protein
MAQRRRSSPEIAGGYSLMDRQTPRLLRCPINCSQTRVETKLPNVGKRIGNNSHALVPFASGMSTEQVLSIAGKPDAIDKREESQSTNSTGPPQHIGLLGFCAADRGENLAYIFFTERWTIDIFRHDPLRDRYVILFFSAEGKFTRMFSNVADIPPIFPQSETSWRRLMWGEPKIKK